MISKLPSVAPGVEILHEGEGCLFGSWKNLLVATWTTQCTGPLAESLGRVAGPFAKAHPEGFSSIHVIGNKPPLPTSEARETLIAQMRQYSNEVACIGTVLEGSGFWASAVRSFIVGLRFVVPRTFEMQTYASIPELAAWLPPLHAARTGVVIEKAELERTLVAFRARLG